MLVALAIPKDPLLQRIHRAFQPAIAQFQQLRIEQIAQRGRLYLVIIPGCGWGLVRPVSRNLPGERHQLGGGTRHPIQEDDVFGRSVTCPRNIGQQRSGNLYRGLARRPRCWHEAFELRKELPGRWAKTYLVRIAGDKPRTSATH